MEETLHLMASPANAERPIAAVRGFEAGKELIRDKAQFAAHWQDELKCWWPEGVDSPGLTLIEVQAERLHYSDGGDEGEVASAGAGVQA